MKTDALNVTISNAIILLALSLATGCSSPVPDELDEPVETQWITSNMCLDSGLVASEAELFTQDVLESRDFVEQNGEEIRGAFDEALKQIQSEKGIEGRLVVGEFKLFDLDAGNLSTSQKTALRSGFLPESCQTCVKTTCGPNSPHIYCCDVIPNCCSRL